MKKYSIFYRESGKYYQIYQDQNGKFWLGGSRCQWLLFYTKAEAEKVAKQARRQKLPSFERGTITVSQARLQPWD